MNNLKESPTQSNLILVKDMQPCSTIVIADDADWWQRMAAGWLREYIEKATGAKLAIKRESEKSDGVIISVGHTQLAKSANIKTDDLKWDSCKLVVRGDVLFLIGRDATGVGRGDPSKEEIIRFTKEQPWLPDRPFPVSYLESFTHGADKAGANGTCRAAVTFLEDICHVRWFLPFDKGTMIPKTKDLSVPRNLDKTVTPTLAYVNGTYIYGSPRMSPAAFANNNRLSVRMKTYGGHTWNAWVPESLFQEHPEYFALIKGKRTVRHGHLCTTNPDVAKLLLKRMREVFDQGYEWVQLGQSDGWKRCECDKCEVADNWRTYDEKIDGDWYRYVNGFFRENPCERIFKLHNWLIDEVAKSHPDKIVHLLVYEPTRWPSNNAEYPQLNVVAEVCNGRYPKSPETWKDKVKALTAFRYWWDISWIHGYRPTVSPKEIREQFEYFVEHNIIGIFLGGECSNFGLNGPAFYTVGRLAGDATLDENKIVREYCLGLYAEAGEDMHAFFKYLYDRPLYNFRYAPGTPHGQVVSNIFPQRVIEQLDTLLAQAEAKALTDNTKQWVRMTRYQLDYLKHVTNMWVTYEAYQLAQNRASLLELKKHVDDFEEYRKMILSMDPQTTPITFPDWPWLCKWLTGADYWVPWMDQRDKYDVEKVRQTPIGYYASIKEPITLDFDTLLKSVK